MMDKTDIKQRVRLADIVPGLTRHGQYWIGPCPLCGEGVDRFNVKETPDGDLWLCRKCGDGKYHDVIDFFRRRDGLSYPEIINRLAGGAGSAARVGAPTPAAATPRPSRAATLEPAPAEAWQIAGLVAAAECAVTLWGESAVGRAALAYLSGTRPRTFHADGTVDYDGDRCLMPETVRAAGLGYNPRRQILPNGCALPRGITLPCMIDGELWAVKVRTPPGDVKSAAARGERVNKYPQLVGSKPALFGADRLIGAAAAFVVEGEFDALLLGQYCPPDVAVVTMGGVGNLPGIAWLRYFAAVDDIILLLDEDERGRAALARWQNIMPRARAAALPWGRAGQPARGEHDKDLTDFRRAGGNLVAWVAAVLRNENDGNRR